MSIVKKHLSDSSMTKAGKNDQSKKKRKFSKVEPTSFDTTEGEKPDWKKYKAERKELRQKRREISAGGNEIYELSTKAKHIWEEMRRDDCKDDRKRQLCAELFGLIKGKVKSLIYAHDTVRVVETLVSAGGEEIKARLFTELKDDLLNLSKNKYSRFFVIKLLKYGTKAQKNAIIEAMRGNVVDLMCHKIASDVVELAYNDYSNAKQRSNMIQEFYGPRFKYFKEDICSLDEALQTHPEMRESILSDVYKILQPIIDKGVFSNVIVHTLLKEYMIVCGETERNSIIESLREGLLPILHTRDGSRVAMLCLWYGSPKDRKVILKSFKGNYMKIAQEEHGHMVLLAAFDCVDDTVFVSKAVLSELMVGLSELTGSESGRKVLKYLVAPRDKIYFHPDVLKVLCMGDAIGQFKKERSTKYEALQKDIAKPILSLINNNISSWTKNAQWTLFVGSALQSLSDELIVPIFESMADIFGEPYYPGTDHFLEASHMSKLISFTIACDKERHGKGFPYFSKFLLENFSEHLYSWTRTNRGCFILLKLIETEIDDVKSKVLDLCESRKGLNKLDFPGAKLLLEKLNKC